MTRFPKILTVTLSLIATVLSVMAIQTSTHSARTVVSRISAAPTVAVVSLYATDSERFGEQAVTAYLDGIARQERADAEAARVEQERAVERDQAPRPVTTGAAPSTAATPAPSAPYVGGIHAQPFLICVRRHESDRSDVNGNGLHDGGYAAKNPSSSAAGAYQYLTSTWNSVVNAMGHPEWAGDPRDFSDDMQDQVAWWTYQNQGAGPWAGSGCF